MGLSLSHQKWKISPICPLWFAAMDPAKCLLTPRLANWVRFIMARSTMKCMQPICHINKQCQWRWSESVRSSDFSKGLGSIHYSACLLKTLPLFPPLSAPFKSSSWHPPSGVGLRKSMLECEQQPRFPSSFLSFFIIPLISDNQIKAALVIRRLWLIDILFIDLKMHLLATPKVTRL